MMTNQLTQNSLEILADIQELRRTPAYSLVDKVLERIKQYMNAENLTIELGDGTLFPYWFSTDPTSLKDQKRPSHRVIDIARGSTKGYHVENIHDGDPSKSQISENIVSCCAATVEYCMKTIAVIYCDLRQSSKRTFTDEHGAFLKELANIFGIFLYAFLGNEKAVVLEIRKRQLEKDLRTASRDPVLIGRSPVMQTLNARLHEAAVNPDFPVLLLGETGTGKNLCALEIHKRSARCNGPFQHVVCSEITDTLGLSEFLGHNRGSFTNAAEKRRGLLLTGDGGTVFLDEVGDLSVAMQAALLRVIETKKVRPVGSDTAIEADFRIIAATNKNLPEMVERNEFRRDLFYRLNPFTITLPALPERKDDIPLLAEWFAQPHGIEPSACQYLMTIDFPGDVRELRDIVDLTKGRVANRTQGGRRNPITKMDIDETMELVRARNLYSPRGASSSVPATAGASRVPAPPSSPIVRSALPNAGVHGYLKAFQEGTLHVMEAMNLFRHHKMDAESYKALINSMNQMVGNNWQEVGRRMNAKESDGTMAQWNNFIDYLRKKQLIPKRVRTSDSSQEGDSNETLDVEADFSGGATTEGRSRV